jgi:hypothetical protein
VRKESPRKICPKFVSHIRTFSKLKSTAERANLDLQKMELFIRKDQKKKENEGMQRSVAR